LTSSSNFAMQLSFGIVIANDASSLELETPMVLTFTLKVNVCDAGEVIL
jgi:hypothetical protein